MRKLFPILLAGFVAGALDIVSAFASYSVQGFTPQGILKYIAAGLVGPGAMKGGTEMVALGLLCHFVLTTAMAAIFLFAALRVSALVARPWFWGLVYGFLTWVGMVYIVVPLSGAPGWKLPVGWAIVSGLMAHFFYVGVPIAHITRWGLSDARRSGA